jgi:uridine kinase
VTLFGNIVAGTPAPEGRPALVAVDGVDGSGKTTFATHLADAYRRAGRTPLVVHEDDFLNPRSVRYRLGRNSPEGFFLHTYDLSALTARVLDAVRSGGRRVIPAAFDYRTDTPVDVEPFEVPERGVVIVEGMFLHRDELVGRWDLSIFLDVPFAETARRMAARDGSNADPEHPSMRRYVEGQRNYMVRCDPRLRATLVVDNTDPIAPRIS